MIKQISITFGLIVLFTLNGCETTNSIPYKASTDNVIKIQENMKSNGAMVRLGDFNMAPGVDENVLCRLMGPVKVAPGKTLSAYIKDAFQEELFMAKVYSTDAPTIISGTVDALSFSSVSPAYWDISMTVKSNTYSGYQVKTRYEFDTSWTAYSACKNVADAFAPAVQSLLQKVISNPEFKNLTKN
jgi:hypothetical protein